MHHLHQFSTKKKTGRNPLPPPPPMRKEKNIPHHVYRSFEGKNYTQFWGEKSIDNRQKWAKNASFAFSQGDPDPPPPPLLREDKKKPLLALYDPQQLRWKFSRITYIGALNAKNTHNFGGKININSAKMGSQCTVYIHFSKFSRGRTP